jgi:S-adenosylmethionine/arginine decarboxylase-like enzyme
MESNKLKRKVQHVLYGVIGVSSIIMLVAIAITIWQYVNYGYATVTL